ncbi:MAG: pitrilysin family protein [Flavobacteriales bacterium]
MKKVLYTLLALVAIAISSCKSGQLDRSIVPSPAPAPTIQIGDYQLFTLENGLKVIVVENHKLPRVSYSINFDIDPILEGEKAGYVQFAGDLMSAGTTTKSKAEIDEKIDFMGARLSTSAGGVFGSCLKKHSEEYLSIMSDVLMNPTFPEEELDKLRKQTISGLASEKTDPNSISGKISSLMNYGSNHPYGEQQTEKSVESITRADLVSFYSSYVKPNVSYLVIVGDITADQAKVQAEKYFGSWAKGNVMGMKYKTPVEPSNNVVAFVPLPGAVQSVIDITYPINLQPGTEDAIKASVLNNILGGSGFQARLMQNLREDKAYTYGAYSSISSDEVVGSFSAGASVRNEVTDSAIVQFLYEMDRLVKEPVPDTTLQAIKNIMTGSFARSLESPQTIARFAYNIEKYNLPKDYYQTYLQKLNAITPADVQEVAKKFIRPENCYITVVGNKEIQDKLSIFEKDGEISVFNPDGTVYTDLKPAPEGVTAQTVLQNYINAIGGSENILKIKSIEQVGKYGMGPMQLDMNVKMKDQSKMAMSIAMNGMEMMKQVFDGTKGMSSQMGQKSEMGEDEIAAAREQMDMLYELHLAQYNKTAELKGIDELNGEEVYVVEVKESNGDTSTDYYSVASGLKLQSLSVTQNEGESVTIQTTFSDYKEYGGVKFVTKTVQAAGGQEVTIAVSEIKINPKFDDSTFKVD